MRSSWPRLLLSVAVAAMVPVASAQEIKGAGASFPAPLYAKWADAYNKATGAHVTYQSIGSGAGIRQIRGKTVDFGASDAPLPDAELTNDALIQFPTVIGGVVPVVNIKGIAPGRMTLTGPVLADIYLGKIVKWNDPAIVALNPGVPLPEVAIAVVRRGDGSGTSFLFTNYLSKVSSEWKSKVGQGTTVNWPTGIGGKGNENVVSFVQRLPNSIGYVEYAFAQQNKLTYVKMRNQAGNAVVPGSQSFKAAAARAAWQQSLSQILTDQPGSESWPITGATFILMYVKPDKPRQAAAALEFFDWAYTEGDAMALELDYVPLPDDIKSVVRAQWRKIIRASGKPNSR
jgi:phosphate transport system substrate-binding protein